MSLPKALNSMGKIQDLLQTMNPDPVCVRNAGGRILYANETFSKIFCGGETVTGRLATDLLPQTLLDHLPPVRTDGWLFMNDGG